VGKYLFSIVGKSSAPVDPTGGPGMIGDAADLTAFYAHEGRLFDPLASGTVPIVLE